MIIEEAKKMPLPDVYIYAIDNRFDRTIGEYRPVLVRLRVLRETNKRIETERGSLAFNCRTQHKPKEVHRTPEAAWTAYIKSAYDELAAANKHVESVTVRVNIAAIEKAKKTPAIDGNRSYL